jgi:hypothetical protein
MSSLREIRARIGMDRIAGIEALDAARQLRITFERRSTAATWAEEWAAPI